MGQLANVPDSTVLPKCDVLCRIASLKKVKSSTGKLMYKAEYRVVDDGEGRFKNLPIFDQYVIGSDKDPDADSDKTWIEAPGARNMKRLFKKLGLDTTKDVDDLVDESEDQEIGLSLTKYIEPEKRRDGSDNPFAGQPRNRVSNFWTPGEKEPQIFEEPDEDGAAVTTTAKAAKPAGKASAKKAAAAAVEEEEEESTGNGTTPPRAAKASAKAEKMLTCPECEDEFPKSEFGSHITEAH